MKDFKTLPSRSINGGIQYVFRADNGYGASIVQHSFSYGSEQGLWELAVVKYKGDGQYDYSLCYDTPITDDVLGRLSEDRVNATLEEIAALKPTK